VAEKASNKKLLETIRKRYRVMVDADERNRTLAIDDMKFVNVPGAQWEETVKLERGDRPCYEFNKIRVSCKRIINDMRASRPQGKVRGVEGTDKELADIYEGLIRNIWNNSDGDTVIDAAAEYQVSGGMGAWRVTTKYATDNAFEQDICVEPIHNPFCLYADPAAKDPLKRDAHDFIFTEKISKLDFETRYPKADKVDWEASAYDDEDEWDDGETVRICEYWWKDPVDREIWQLEDGKVIAADSDEAAAIPQEAIKKRRSIRTHQVKMCIASGEAILEGPIDWAGREIPFIIIYGESMVIDGRHEWFGLPRFAKDAQRSYNAARTAITETIALAPQAKFWATTAQADGHTEKWAEAHKKNFPFQLFNADPMSPGAPQRMGGADVPVALIQESQLASEEIKAVTGIFSADLGSPNQATSGRQEIARQQQGQLATFNYTDNMSKGIRRTWEILIDLIPKIYDTERELRVLGNDGAENYVKINTFVPGPTGEPIKINDLSVGRYDVTVTVGPGFATKRQEAVETYMGLIQGNPQIMGLAGDLIFKSMDLPYADDIADRMKSMLPPQIQQMLSEGKDIPPEAQAVMAQAQQAMQMVQQQAQQIEAAAQELEQEKSMTEKAKSEVQQLIADLKTEEAQFEAKIAKEMARLTERQANVTVSEAQLEQEVARVTIAQANGDIEVGREVIAQEMAQVTNAAQAINQMYEDFQNYAMGVMSDITEKGKTLKPKIVRVESRRENGKLIAVPIYEETDRTESGQADA